MRCVGEIDITRPRWSERSTELVHLLLGNITNFEPGESARRIGQGRQEAWEKEQEVLERLRALRGAEGRRGQADDRPRPDVQRYREYPKYDIISRCFIYKQALLAEARRLVAAGRLREAEDAFHLTFQEFHEAVRTRAADHELIARRRAAFVANAALTPPRVLTSERKAVNGAYPRDGLPEGALIGLPVSTRTIEARARVILDMADAEVEPGDILVTTHTDPSWSRLFVAVVPGDRGRGPDDPRRRDRARVRAAGVVGVEQATKMIRDGQRIRVHGTEGYVEMVSDARRARATRRLAVSAGRRARPRRPARHPRGQAK